MFLMSFDKLNPLLAMVYLSIGHCYLGVGLLGLSFLSRIRTFVSHSASNVMIFVADLHLPEVKNGEGDGSLLCCSKYSQMTSLPHL